MATHDYVIANQNGANTRSDLNNALSAIVSNNSSATEPSTTYAYMWWADTATDTLKQRNAADSAWISILTLSTAAPLGTLSSSLLSGALPAIDGSALLNLPGGGADGLFYKADSSAVAFVKNGSGLDVKAGTKVWQLNGTVKEYASATAITLPSMTNGTDYAIYVCDDGTTRADANFSAPTGYTTSNSRKIGGFHYDLGGAINAYSLWDLKFKPACNDPRGMALVADKFWADIYLTGTDCDVNGTSKAGVTIADGLSPPKIPTLFGGNGLTTYGSFKQYEASELVGAFGKRLLTYDEFTQMAYGISGEATSVGLDQVTTQRNSAYTSKWGCEQVAGVMWQWGSDKVSNLSGLWQAQTEGRGSFYNTPYGALLGGGWGNGSDAGSRCLSFSVTLWVSDSSIGARACCDHLQLV